MLILRLSLPSAIAAALVSGAIFGILAPEWAPHLAWISEIFLRLIRSIVAPLLFGVLVTAVAEAGGRGLSRLGWRSVVYFEVVSALALVVGWAAIAILNPGPIPLANAATGGPPARSASALIIAAFPESIIDAMGRGDVLQIVVFSILLGAAASRVKEKAEPLRQFTASLAAVTHEFTRFLMWIAPPAVFAAIAGLASRSARQSFETLAGFTAAAWGAQAVYLIFVIGGVLLMARLPLRSFIRHAKEPFVVGFATTSSAAALPKILESCHALGVPPPVYGIVAPLSLSLNASGSCIHLAMCAFFAAQAAGIPLTISQQIMILLTLKLTSKGVVGIPRANFLVLSGLFSTFSLPAEMLTILLAIDALIDPVRTSVNVLGHCAAPALIHRWESRG
jgi:proton glutamate symport protein